MNDPLIVLTPLLVLLILALFRFTGCKSFGSAESVGTVAGPPLGGAPPPGDAPPPVPSPSYAQLVADTKGFAARWPLDETGGNVAAVVGSMTPAPIGSYETSTTTPIASQLTHGLPGVPLDKGKNSNFAPKFLGTGAYVEVPFRGPLNPGKTLPGFSIELWVKPDPNVGPATQVVISSHRVDIRQGYEIALIKNPTEPHQQIRGRVFAGSAANITEVTVQPSQGDPNEWRYIVLTFEGGVDASKHKLTLHVRIMKLPGRFEEAAPLPARYDSVGQASPATLRFGAGHGPAQKAANFFAGQIDEVAFYNSVLGLVDMDKHFNNV